MERIIQLYLPAIYSAIYLQSTCNLPYNLPCNLSGITVHSTLQSLRDYGPFYPAIYSGITVHSTLQSTRDIRQSTRDIRQSTIGKLHYQQLNLYNSLHFFTLFYISYTHIILSFFYYFFIFIFSFLF